MNVAFLLVGKNGHAQLASLMVDSLRRVMPDSVITQQTDMVTDPIGGTDRVERLAWDGKLLMTYRLRHLANLREPTLVLDADVLVQQDVSEIEAIEGDVVLALRYGYHRRRAKNAAIMQTMPYNTGVMFARNPAFFEDCLAWCERASRRIQKWGGDQLAVAAVASIGKYNVGTMPGRVFNFSPKRPDDKKLRRAAIVHYKGAERKEWMLDRAAVI